MRIPRQRRARRFKLGLAARTLRRLHHDIAVLVERKRSDRPAITCGGASAAAAWTMQHGTVVKWSLCVGLSLPIALTAACDSIDDLEAARARWREHRIDSYSFDYRTLGFAPRADARIVVVDGVPVAVENHLDEIVLPLDRAPTIETLFDEVDQTRANANATIQWDPAFGFPATALFDNGSEHWSFEVSAFSPGA